MAASMFFNGKAVIVTGSSNGIGRETARMFAERGARVTITGRNAESLKQTRDLCLSAGAKEADIVEVIGDFESEETPKKIVDETIRAFGAIDVLVNNAGMALADMKGRVYLDVPLADFDRTLNVNLRSILAISQLATPYLEKTKGAIVNVSSIAGLNFAQTNSYYGISKAALDQLTVQMAAAYIKKGIRVNSVNPGLVVTDIVRKMGVGEELEKSLYGLGDNTTMVPLGRVGVPADIGKLIVFLSDRTQSEFIIGQRIVIDGGTTMKNPLLSMEM